MLRLTHQSLTDKKIKYQTGDYFSLQSGIFSEILKRNSTLKSLVVSFNTKGIDLQLFWISQIIEGQVFSKVLESYIIGKNVDEFDILFICGNDCKRIIKLISCYRHIISKKIILAVLPFSSPHDRANLLKSGFDDVFDTNYSAVEAKCRINSYINRLNVTKKSIAVMQNEYNKLELYKKDNKNLSERESIILKKLTDSIGQAVNVFDLHKLIRKKYGKSNHKALHVCISLLRKKIKSEFMIKFEENGYCLKKI